MASPILHIKDSYYFDLPKSLWPQAFSSKADFTGSLETWLRLDPEFQAWEASRFYDAYAKLKTTSAPAKVEMLHSYEAWKHDHAHEGMPFWRFVSEASPEVGGDHTWFQAQSQASSSFRSAWKAAIEESSGPQALAAYRSSGTEWSRQKLDGYAAHLSGKVLIPQPFGRLRNLYEKDSGVCISRYMLIEVAVALLLWGVFSWLARNVSEGARPRGALWNLLEAFVGFIRDEVARPVIGHEAPKLATAQAGHHADHDAHGHDDKPAHEDHDHHHDPAFDADRFVPLLLTIFFFVLGCNLAGMLPWLGSPTAVWGTTSAIAAVTFATGLLFGFRRFGVVGYFLNQVPAMDLPPAMAVVLKPMIFLIEILGLLIKHTVLSIRLLANMLAGHLVLIIIMSLAFSAQGVASGAWGIAAPASIIGCALLSCLELFVAFLQAYIFTFLSAMFIGAAIHHH